MAIGTDVFLYCHEFCDYDVITIIVYNEYCFHYTTVVGTLASVYTVL